MRLRKLRNEIGDTAIMTVAVVIAGGFDYATNLLAGRWLVGGQFATFLAVNAVLQLVVQGTNVIRNVVAYYVAGEQSVAGNQGVASSFFRNRWQWGWRWGLVSTGIFLLVSPVLSRLVGVSPWIVWVPAALTVLMLFVRPVTDGALQGLQRFLGLAAVSISQAVARVGLLVGLLVLGFGVGGALLALPLAMGVGTLVALRFLPNLRETADSVQLPQISSRYSVGSLAGLMAFALMINMDAILVNRFFSATAADNYGVLVTFGKINLFVPLALGMVLFPKAVEQFNQGENPIGLLLRAIGLVLVAGLAVTAGTYLLADQLVPLLFRGSYSVTQTQVGLIGLATTLFAMVNIWVQYALSTKNRGFIVVLTGIAVGQLVAMVAVAGRGSAETLLTTLLISGICANIAGVLLMFRRN